MPEADIEGARFYADQAQGTPGFFLKGSHQLDWGMKNRLARIFNPATGRTVMLAIDHGYFQGPTTGLERIDLTIVPLLPSCDALICTRGILRSRHSGRVRQSRGAARQRRPEHPRRNCPTSRSRWTWRTPCA